MCADFQCFKVYISFFTEIGPHPAVLDLYTYGRGLSEARASLLANRGFVVFTVSLYGYDDNHKNMTKIHLEYFEEAIQFLKNQPQVSIK